MPRPRNPIGTFGKINIRKVSATRHEAETRVRDDDGSTHRVRATGASKAEAERLLKAKLSTRSEMHQRFGALHGDSSFAELVEVWKADLKLRGLTVSSGFRYVTDMDKLVAPKFKNLTLREITVRRVDTFLKEQAQRSYSRAKKSKTVLSLSLGLAVRYGAISKNPVRDVEQIKRPATDPVALTLQEVEEIRRAIKTWRRGPGIVGPRPDGQLDAIIELMLGTSMRIGEVLAVRRKEVDLTVTPATVRITGTIIAIPGVPTFRQDHPKSSKSRRTVTLPAYAETALRERLARVPEINPDDLVFISRRNTPLVPGNMRTRLRKILAGAEVTYSSPHAFRRTVATFLNRLASADLAAEMLGHSSSDITRKHYIEPDEAVDPKTASLLEQALSPGDGKASDQSRDDSGRAAG